MLSAGLLGRRAEPERVPAKAPTAGRVEGEDPLAGFGPHAADDLRRHDGLAHAADVLVNSVLDPDGQGVAAFEELIGCHGGLGGWQNQPLLVHPRDWTVESDLVGADAVHQQLRSWLDRLQGAGRTGRPALPRRSRETDRR